MRTAPQADSINGRHVRVHDDDRGKPTCDLRPVAQLDAHLESLAGSRERAIAGVTTGSIGLGEEVTWRAVHFGIPSRMTSSITELERPTRFVDEQVRGPFRWFRHEHLFEAKEAGTLMTDRVSFQAPAAGLGWAVERASSAAT